MAVTAAQLAVKVSVEGAQQAADDLKKVSDTTDEGKGHLNGFLTTMLGFAGAQIGVASVSDAFGFLKDQLTDTISAGMEANTTEAQTAAVLKSTHDASGETAESIDALAMKYMGLTGVSKDTVQQTENMLLTFDNISSKSMPAATQAALDMAQAMGGDAKQEALQLGIALNNPEQGITRLTRVGVTFTQAQKDQIKAMQDSGNMAGAQAIILKELQKEFGGSAEAAGKANGGIKILTAQLDTAREEIGQALIPILGGLLGAITPVVVALASNLPGAISAVVSAGQNLVGFFQSASPAADAVKVILLALTGAALGMAASAIPAAIAAISASVVAFGAQAVAAGAAAVATLAAAAPFILIGAGIALVIAGLYELITHWSQVSVWLQSVWQAVTKAVGGWFSDLGATMQGVVTAIKTVIQDGFDFVKAVIQDDINDVVAIFSWLYDHNTYFADLVNAIKADFTALKDDLTAIWGAITAFFTRAWNGDVELATAAFNLVKSVVETAFDFVKNIITNDLNFVRSIFTTVWNGLVSIVTSVGGRIGGAVTDSVVTPIKTLLSNLVSQAEQWGSNLMHMFISGVTGEAGALKNAVMNTLGGLAKVLGFHSPAEEGPGADADTWAPNLMRMFAQGLLDATPSLTQAATTALAGVRDALTSGATGSIALTGTLSGGLGGLAPGAASGLVAPSASALLSQQIASAGGSATSAGGQPVILVLDGRAVARGLLPYTTSEIRRAVGIRTM